MALRTVARAGLLLRCARDAPQGRRGWGLQARPRKSYAEARRRAAGGAHSTRSPAWVYPLAILIGAFILPAPQASEGGGGRPQGRRKQPWKSYMQSTRKHDAPSAEQQGCAFDPLPGMGIPPGAINWCIHPPAAVHILYQYGPCFR